jgi:hypothetical protein
MRATGVADNMRGIGVVPSQRARRSSRIISSEEVEKGIDRFFFLFIKYCIRKI